MRVEAGLGGSASEHACCEPVPAGATPRAARGRRPPSARATSAFTAQAQAEVRLVSASRESRWPSSSRHCRLASRPELERLAIVVAADSRSQGGRVGLSIVPTRPSPITESARRDRDSTHAEKPTRGVARSTRHATSGVWARLAPASLGCPTSTRPLHGYWTPHGCRGHPFFKIKQTKRTRNRHGTAASRAGTVVGSARRAGGGINRRQTAGHQLLRSHDPHMQQ